MILKEVNNWRAKVKILLRFRDQLNVRWFECLDKTTQAGDVFFADYFGLPFGNFFPFTFVMHFATLSLKNPSQFKLLVNKHILVLGWE